MALTPKLVKDAETDLVDIGEIASGPVEPGFVTTRFGGPIKTLRRLMADMEQEAAGPISDAITAAEILRDQTQAFLVEALAIAASGNDAAAIGARARRDKNLEDLTDKEAANRNLGTFATRALAQAATIPANLTAITLRGYASAGDGGGALYKRVASEPAHPGKFQSADGQWWGLAEPTVSVRMFGAVGDGETDDTSAFEKAIAGSLSVFIPAGQYRITRTLKTRAETKLYGDGRASVLIADNVVGPVILTYPGTGEGTAVAQITADFVIVGKATCAIAFSHYTHGRASGLHLEERGYGSTRRFEGQDGFVFEYLWGSVFNGLWTNGALLSGSCFKLNRSVLNTEFAMLYTSNFCPYLFDIGGARREYSTGTGLGTGRNAFRSCTLQGANKYAIKIANYSNLLFDNLYSENNLGILDLRSGSDITFIRSQLTGLRAGSTHDIWIDASGESETINGVSFIDCGFSDTRKKVVGHISAQVTFMQPRCTGNAEFFTLIERTADTLAGMPVRCEWGRTSYIKTDNNGWKFAKVVLTEQAGGALVHSITPIVPPITTVTRY